MLVDPDGLAIAVALGTTEMLGWADRSWDKSPSSLLAMNRFVVAEWPFEFIRFVRDQLAKANTTGWKLRISGLRLQSGKPPLTWRPGQFGFGQPAVIDNPTETVPMSMDPERDGFVAMRTLLGWFDADVDHPWVADERISMERMQAPPR